MEIKVGKYTLDKEQSDIVIDNNKYLLVAAGAGSGKTLTILGKLSYLLKKMNPSEIICISFTKAASQSLKNKISKELKTEINVYTFHALALEILENKYAIAMPNTLELIVEHFLKTEILENKELLKKLLKYLNIKSCDDYIKNFENNEKIKMLENLICTFIRLFKCNNFKLIDYNAFLEKIKSINNFIKYKKEKIFLTITLNCYLRYEKYLEENKEIDFDDMLIKAKEKVDSNNYHKKIKYIIIDEYQDTSLVRFDFIKSILEKTNANLLVVGDDFQSIYRFTGCDLSLFIDFKKFFKNAQIKKIQNTYRNSQELINVAGKFVMKNKSQIEKNLKSSKHINKPIVIVKYKNEKNDFASLIEKIYFETKSPILILGRNNFDINEVIDKNKFIINDDKIIYKTNKNINIRYLTAHKSKGLEEENVIIINLKNKILGFPNQKKDASVLRLVTNYNVTYPYDEERRLFYVALTRTKNKVYLYTPQNPSIFVTELLKEHKKYIEIIKIS